MRLLAIRHVPFEHLGLIAPALEAAGIHFDYIDLFRQPEATVPLEAAAGLIFMGGPMSANDDVPFVRRELRLIEAGLAAGKPMLGVCLGAQLIAKALGAPVYRNPVKEIGWAPIHWTEAAGSDRLFSQLNGPEQIFHWHGETFDLPNGATWLAYTDACRHQAFRFGSDVYGLQFHLEVTPEMIDEWCRADENCGDVRELSRPIDPHAHAGRLRELADLVFSRWGNLVRESAGLTSDS
jgi:GMP synthase (glutamine-hydrolysing)